MPSCFLAQFSPIQCEGRLRKVHLIPKQTIRRAGGDPWDGRSWVPACGGIMGLSGHHGMLDQHTLQIPREGLPAAVLSLAEDLDLLWWLDRRYGPENTNARAGGNPGEGVDYY